MPFVTRLPALTGADPYPDALLVLDFVGARRGPQYYKALGVTTADITKIPGWTYTGGTPAGTGSYAARQDGSLQFFPSYTNLLLQSQTFNTSWTISGSTVTADQTTAPNGTLTAEKLDEQTNTGAHQLYQSVTVASGASYTISFYLKAAERTYAAIWDGGTSKGKFFNLSAGTVGGNLVGAPDNATITNAGNGWYRCTVTITTASTTLTPYIFLSTDGSTFNYTGTAGSGIYIWGAQLELGSTASTYIPTTTAAVTVATPRITDAGYDVWESRTNLLLRSQEFDNASWTKGTVVTISSNATAAPDGTTTADLVIPSTASSTHEVSQSATHTAASYTVSIYAKPAGYDRIGFRENTTSGAYVVASLTGSGSILANNLGTSTITALANGWYRVTMTWTASAVSQQLGFYVVGPGYTSGSPHAYSWAGDGTSGVYFWQAQDELGSFATSPIPTTSVAVTRAADLTPGLSNITSAFDAANGTVFVEFVRNSPSGSNARAFSVNETVQFNTTITLTGQSSVVGNVTETANALTLGARTRLAMAWTGTSAVALNMNGGAVATGTYALGSVAGQNLILGNRAAGDRALNGPIRRIVIYPRAFGNSELQAITTAGAY